MSTPLLRGRHKRRSKFGLLLYSYTYIYVRTCTVACTIRVIRTSKWTALWGERSECINHELLQVRSSVCFVDSAIVLRLLRRASLSSAASAWRLSAWKGATLIVYLNKAFSRMETESDCSTRTRSPPPVGSGKSRGISEEREEHLRRRR